MHESQALNMFWKVRTISDRAIGQDGRSFAQGKRIGLNLPRLVKTVSLYHALDRLSIDTGFLSRITHVPLMALEQL